MHFLLIAGLMLCVASPGQARDCSRNFDDRGLSQGANNNGMFRCLIAEINDLKREQRRMQKVIDEYERVIGEMPVEYKNEDGEVTVEEDRPIGNAVFTLTARPGSRASALPLDHEVVEGLCAESGGCTVSLVFRAIGFRSTDPLETISAGPCLFDYNTETGAWTRGEGCGEPLTAAGADNDGALMGDDGGGEVIVTAGEACVLADASVDPSATDGGYLGKDRENGLFLLAVPSLIETGPRRFRCDLEIE